VRKKKETTSDQTQRGRRRELPPSSDESSGCSLSRRVPAATMNRTGPIQSVLKLRQRRHRGLHSRNARGREAEIGERPGLRAWLQPNLSVFVRSLVLTSASASSSSASTASTSSRLAGAVSSALFIGRAAEATTSGESHGHGRGQSRAKQVALLSARVSVLCVADVSVLSALEASRAARGSSASSASRGASARSLLGGLRSGLAGAAASRRSALEDAQRSILAKEVEVGSLSLQHDNNNEEQHNKQTRQCQRADEEA
jgi:hypothetical protein